jgi:hypothetical protein
MWGEAEGKDKRMHTRILYKNNIQSTTRGTEVKKICWDEKVRWK